MCYEHTRLTKEITAAGLQVENVRLYKETMGDIRLVKENIKRILMKPATILFSETRIQI